MHSCRCPSSGSSRFPLLLRLKLLVLFAAVLCNATSSKAQDKVEIFGGYSYFRAAIREGQLTCPVCLPPLLLTHPTPNANLNGWEFSGQYKLLPFVGAVADFNGTYGTLNGAGTREHTFLFGPQVSLPASVSPFAHALFGLAKESQDAIPGVPPGLCPATNPTCAVRFSLGSDTSFATAIGAGFDIKLAPFVKVRLIQVDYLRTQLHGATQNQPRASAGIVFHF
jgi:hypothetical protein